MKEKGGYAICSFIDHKRKILLETLLSSTGLAPVQTTKDQKKTPKANSFPLYIEKKASITTNS
jgi:hypothetical protein